MLDVNVGKLFSIEATLPEKKNNTSKVLLLRACKVYIFDNERIYSDFEDQTFNILNGDNGYGAMDIEFVIENNIAKESYPEFYTKCFVMRTDTCFFLKPMKFFNSTSCSKN